MTRWSRLIAARRENILTAFRAIREQKLRSFLTCLGIIIGVATVILMVGVIQGFNRQFIQQFESFGATLVQFQKLDDRFGEGGPLPEEQRLRPNLTLDDAEAITPSCHRLRLGRALGWPPAECGIATAAIEPSVGDVISYPTTTSWARKVLHRR